eukprot:9521377-Alexandrium_andersonii.AAC.1
MGAQDRGGGRRYVPRVLQGRGGFRWDWPRLPQGGRGQRGLPRDPRHAGPRGAGLARPELALAGRSVLVERGG